MVRDKLRRALEDAVKHYNDGMSATEAVVKSASEHDLTVDQTDRVVESFNTAKTINYFDKNASDRTGKFDLANKKDVTLAIFGKMPEKKASVRKVADPDTLSSFYMGAPDRSGNRKHLFAEKRAAFLTEMAKEASNNWAYGYSSNTLHAVAADRDSMLKSAEEDIDTALRMLDGYLMTATEKIAKDLSSGAYEEPEDKANLFKVACPHAIVLKEVSKICPLLKRASGGEYAKQNVVDTTKIDSILKEADDIVTAVAQRKIYRQKKAEFAKKRESLKEAMFNSMGITPKTEKSAEDFLHVPSMNKKAQLLDLFPVSDSKKILDSVASKSSNKDQNEHIRDEARGALLADLLSSDPILQDADPRQVAAIYKSIVSASPRVSMNKEVMRSVLRGAVNSIAISPNDVKVLTDVDRGISQAYGAGDASTEKKEGIL